MRVTAGCIVEDIPRHPPACNKAVSWIPPESRLSNENRLQELEGIPTCNDVSHRISVDAARNFRDFRKGHFHPEINSTSRDLAGNNERIISRASGTLNLLDPRAGKNLRELLNCLATMDII